MIGFEGYCKTGAVQQVYGRMVTVECRGEVKGNVY